MLINDLYTNKTPTMAEAIGDLGSSRDRGKSIRKWRKQHGLDEQGLAEDWDSIPDQYKNDIEAFKRLFPATKASILAKAHIIKTDSYGNVLIKKPKWNYQQQREEMVDTPVNPDEIDLDAIYKKAKHDYYIQQGDREDELGMGATGRRELQRQADELAEMKRVTLRNERLHDEEVAFQRAETIQQRKDEMKKIADKYAHDLKVINTEHSNNMQAIRTGNNHEINKMNMEYQHEKEMWDKNNPKQEPLTPEYDDEEEYVKPQQSGNKFDQDTGEPIKPNKPPQANQWHTSQQVGYKPTKPINPGHNDDVIDVEPKPNKPLALKEKVSIVRAPAQATGIQRTGGITSGSVYMPGKPRPQSAQQNTGALASSNPSAMNSQKPLMAVSLERWKESVLKRYPEARFATQKMINGATIASDRSGQVGIYDPKNSYAKVGPETHTGVAKGSLNEFAMGDDGEDPTDNYPCYDCGSTIFLHHTKLCELAEPNAKHDLPARPGSQHWTGEIPKGLHPIPGLQEGMAEEQNAPVVHRIGLTVTDPNHPMVSKRQEQYQKSVRVTSADKEKAIASAIAHARRKGYKVHDHHYLGTVDQGVAEGTADDIKKMFGNAYSPEHAALQRVALLAMQGRQQEASGRLQSVIKDASPKVQQKIIDAVNNIKPVTVNGKIADTSALDKSKAHQEWITNTFIPWVESLLGQQGVAEGLADDLAAIAQKKFPNALIRKNGEEVQKPKDGGRPYTPPAQDAEKVRRDLTAKYPNIDELVRQAELRRDPTYDYAEGEAYYRGREAEQNYRRLQQIQRVIQGLNESRNPTHLP